MKFAGLVKQSLVDYPGEVTAVLFTRGCNIRCPFCQNPDLLLRSPRFVEPISLEEALDFLKERKGFLDAVTVTGGEPTLHEDLPHALSAFKALGYLVKLDTNGTNPAMLQQLIAGGILDYVAMDIKAPLDYRKYARACGKLTTEEFFNVRSSIRMLMEAGIEVEFRTTVVPLLHPPEDIEEIARYIQGAPLYSLQQFNPSVTLDTDYGAVVPYTRQEMQALADRCAPFVQNVRVVNI
ncbi:MAG TPA: anaerobic ribonucleoside-triphosphate reductase activating protein [Syntrophomonadaceae bacterium]|nr:anaerobic ribonucleoside-triphosphate reductase activating protein [Syntrophomonadaceae bacterium]